MIPRTFWRGRPASSASVRSLPASTGRGSRTLARMSRVRCSTLRFRTRGLRTRGLRTRGLRTWHSALSPQPSALSPQHWAVGRRPSARRAPHSALCLQPSALGPQPSALGCRAPAFGTPRDALCTLPAALGPRPSALSTGLSGAGLRHAARRAPHSACSPPPSALSPQPSALGRRPSAVAPGTDRPTESCRHPFVSSGRPRTPQPRSLGPVRTHSSGAPMIPRTSAARLASRPNVGRKDVRNPRSPAHGDLESPT